MTPPTTRVLTVPAHHPYVDAVTPSSPVVTRVRPGRTTSWEPDPYLRPKTVRAWAHEVDLVHLHFGYDHLSPLEVSDWVDALRAAGLPLVLTVHDLRNPHHDDRSRHDAALDRLVPAAAEVVTLTAGAAAEIARRWGRTARVVPHPTLLGAAAQPEGLTEVGLVTVHLKSLRRNVVDPVEVVAAVADGSADAGGRLRVDLHPDAVDDPRVRGRLERAAGGPEAVLVHDRFDDAALEHYLRRSHVTVLPYRWGSHSGWLELARDLGTRVVAPSCGYYREQWPDGVLAFGYDEASGLDRAGLRSAVTEALRRPPPLPADRATRVAEGEAGRCAHAEVYARVRQGAQV